MQATVEIIQWKILGPSRISPKNIRARRFSFVLDSE